MFIFLLLLVFDVENKNNTVETPLCLVYKEKVLVQSAERFDEFALLGSFLLSSQQCCPFRINCRMADVRWMLAGAESIRLRRPLQLAITMHILGERDI